MTTNSKPSLPIIVDKGSRRWILDGNARRAIFRRLFESESVEGPTKRRPQASGTNSARFKWPSHA